MVPAGQVLRLKHKGNKKYFDEKKWWKCIFPIYNQGT